jgi:hypothetical protein
VGDKNNCLLLFGELTLERKKSMKIVNFLSYICNFHVSVQLFVLKCLLVKLTAQNVQCLQNTTN